MKVLFIGAGNIGSALGDIAKANGHSVLYWDIDTTKVPNQLSLKESVESTDAIFLCIPSWAIRECVKSISPFLKKDTPIISLAKGMEEASGKAIDEVLAEMLPAKHPFGLCIGPMLAAEITKGIPTAGLIATAYSAVYTKIAPLFAQGCLRLSYESDVRGVALCSILKNIYSVGLGIAEALNFGSNGRGWYVSVAFTEMREIISLLGGNGETAHGLAGIGDLVATGLSPYSRNRTIGEQLVKTGVCGKSEGCIALTPMRAHLGQRAQEFPLFELLHQVIVNGEDARVAFSRVFIA